MSAGIKQLAEALGVEEAVRVKTSKRMNPADLAKARRARAKHKAKERMARKKREKKPQFKMRQKKMAKIRSTRGAAGNRRYFSFECSHCGHGNQGAFEAEDGDK
jgi:hypothetical protein